MFEFSNTHRDVCEGCGKTKIIGCFDIGGLYLNFCSSCLDNASRQIANKADKLYFDRDAGKFINLYKEDIKEWERLYPNIDVIWWIETGIPRWLNKKKGQKKSKKSDWNDFIGKWLEREQMKAVGVM
ncbi:MAG: hypothetical protein V1848_02395 [Candidatus Magasanikbacteria bacterium]